MKIVYLPALLFIFEPLIGCGPAETRPVEWTSSSGEAFANYWFSGEAELTSYDLEQARYGELRKGNAVLIFVTEDFLVDKHVKLEDYSKGKQGSVPVLKVNFTKEFQTGLYPYTMMQSVFSPIDHRAYPHALKATSTVLEWCGQAFLQINKEEDGFRVVQHSYFEKEADREFSLQNAWLEDEFWTRIRTAPESLPTGTIDVIPGMLASRLRHQPPAVEKAVAMVTDHADGTISFSLRYDQSNRDLSIRFNKAFPHEILSWDETYVDGWGDRAKKLTTKGVRKAVLKTDYWTKNKTSDEDLRKKLELE